MEISKECLAMCEYYIKEVNPRVLIMNELVKAMKDATHKQSVTEEK